MTWHVVVIPCRLRTENGEFSPLWTCKDWCQDNLGSAGVLWKYEWNFTGGETLRFMFARPQDATLFRLVNGV